MWLITREQVRLCHEYVPVLYWPVLWLSLVWLNGVLLTAGYEGREQVLFYVQPHGRIRIGFMSESEQARAARDPLGEDFDRAPWTRLAPLAGSALWAMLGGGLSRRTPGAPLSHRGHTILTPLSHPARTTLTQRPAW